jgi:hypothetical protein
VEFLHSLRRRWILAGILLFIALSATGYAYVKLPSTYESESSVVFIVPKSVAKTLEGNPYLGFNSTLNETADVVRYMVMDEPTVDSLAAQGYTSKYLIVDAIDTPGPVLNVTVTGSNKVNVGSTLTAVTNAITAHLGSLQVQVAPANRIRDFVVATAPTPARLSSKKLRPIIAIGALALLLAVGLTVGVDGYLVRRASARRRTPGREDPVPGRGEDRGPGRDEPMPAPRRSSDPIQLANERTLYPPSGPRPAPKPTSSSSSRR